MFPQVFNFISLLAYMKLATLHALSPEKRSSVWSDAGSLSKPGGVLSGYGAYGNSARKNINSQTAERVSAYYACKQILATTMAHCSLNLYKISMERDVDTNEVLEMRHKVKGTINNLLNFQANKRQKSYDAFRQWIEDGYGYGRGIFLIETNARSGAIKQLRLCSRSQGDSWYIQDLGNDITYHLYFRNGDQMSVNQDSILEFKCNARGEPLVKLMAESLGINVATMEYFGETMGNKGKNIKGIFSTEQAVKADQREKLHASFYDQIKAGNDTLLLDTGYKFQGVSMTPAEAQLIEFSNMSVDEICRWFRVPQPLVMHLLKGTGYASLEQLNLHFKTYTLDPIAVEIEKECAVKLLPDWEWDDHYFKYDFTALLRGDINSQSAFFQRLFYVGAYSPNDILKELDKNPYAGGSQRFVPNNTVTPEMVQLMLDQAENKVPVNLDKMPAIGNNSSKDFENE